MTQAPLLFISHASVDAGIAEYLESELRASIPGLAVFRTSRIGQIGPGVEWADVVKENLRAASLFLILLTPTSVARPWVLFETGAAWMARKPLIPLLAGGLRKEDVPEPLDTLQLLSIEDPAQVVEAFRAFGGNTVDPQVFATRVRELGATARERALAKAGWQRMEVDGDVYAWEGPLQDMPEGIPLVAPDGLINALTKAGFLCLPHYQENRLQAHLQGFREVYLLDELGRKRLVMNPWEQIWMVQPKNASRRGR